jgi:hypothetical protein
MSSTTYILFLTITSNYSAAWRLTLLLILEVPEKYRSDYADAGRMNRHYFHESDYVRHEVAIL